MTSDERRAKVAAQASPAIGRNRYSQQSAKRECVFAKYKDGYYYSDCSSFVRWLYRKADIGINNIGGNTVGIILNKNAVEVACNIKSGIPKDVDALRVGDLLLFAGTDASRAYARFVGHVEMVSAIKGDTVTIIGHGYGNPRKTNMVTYCKNRQRQKCKTKRGNKGLISVLRFIPDDLAIMPAPPRTALSVGMEGEDVRTMQQALLVKGFKLPECGADNEYGDETKAAVSEFQKANGLPVTGQADAATLALILAIDDVVTGNVKVTAAISANVRRGPEKTGKPLGTVMRGDLLERSGEDTETWLGVKYKGANGWISAKMADIVD